MSDQTAFTSQHNIDLSEVAHLVASLEEDLIRVQSGSADVQALRDEVESLRQLLGESDHAVVPARLVNLSGLLARMVDTVEIDAIKAAGYVAQIGRLIGIS